MTRFALLLLPALALGCGSDSDTPEASGDAPASSSSQSYAASIADDPCSLAPDSAVASAVGVDASAVAPDEVSMSVLSGLCAYDIEGTDHSVSVIVESVADDAEAAEAQFAQSYRTLTDAEIDQVRGTANEAKADMDEEGEIDATASDALGKTGAGDLIAGMAATIRYEAVDGLGDQAVASYFRDTFDGIYVRHGNLIFQTDVSVGPLEAEAENKAASIAPRAPSSRAGKGLWRGVGPLAHPRSGLWRPAPEAATTRRRRRRLRWSHRRR